MRQVPLCRAQKTAPVQLGPGRFLLAYAARDGLGPGILDSGLGSRGWNREIDLVPFKATAKL